MGEATGIDWCDSTFNIVWGCEKIGPECDFCYAETFDKRVGGDHWGHGKPRRLFGPKHWNEPLRWADKAAKLGAALDHRPRVFCSSMADVFEDHPMVAAERLKLGPLIDKTPALDWLLLTKRHAMIGSCLQQMFPDLRLRQNVWLGCTAGVQKSLDMRWRYLREARAVVRFLSVEPMLERVDLRTSLTRVDLPDWIIIGGESGPKPRNFSIEHARELIRQAQDFGVRVFFKQLGARPTLNGAAIKLPKGDQTGSTVATLRDLHLDDLIVREFPVPRTAPQSA